MKFKKDTFSARLLSDIQKLVLLQLVFIGVAMSTYSYFSFISELKATERLILGQLTTSLTKMLDYGELLYVQPLLESTVKASEGRFKVYVTLKKSSSSDLIAFSGDNSVLSDVFKVQLVTKQFAPYFGEIQVDLAIGYNDQVLKSIWLLIMLILVCGLLSYSLFWRIKKGVSIQSISVDELELVMKGIDTNMTQTDALTKAKSLILEYSNNRAKTSILESIAAQAKQVAHDIRSPLSALTMITGTLKDIPEEKRILIRNATQRINDIANNLLQKGKLPSENMAGDTTEAKAQTGTTQNTTLTQKSVEFIPALVDMLVSEKRMQFREHSGLEIQTDLKNSFGTFSEINSTELKRVLSNLINNAVEAFDNFKGTVTIGVRKINTTAGAKLEIFVADNGKGIPAHLISKLGQMGVSHGKSSSGQSGSGLGLYHAKQTAEEFGGTLEIVSTEGKGSTISFILPLAEAPKWFAQKIDLTSKKYLVSLDDDTSIHQIWGGRLQSLNIKNIEHLKFQSGEVFVKYVNANLNQIKEILFLVDFELLNQPKTGLDIIEELGIEKQSVLVTSRYEEKNIQERASRINLQLLPKALAGFVPIEITQPETKFDAILLDDDSLIHMTWKMVAKEKTKSILCFATREELFLKLKDIDPDCPFYIDENLSNGVKGEQVTKQLFDLGFKNIFLATGYQPEQFQHITWVKAVVGKDPPF